ncbi:MAG: hypothetical protein JGK24_10365 [Microcoleus sp. PH2017_29_MFU_D_A]|uniref:hypothetical protein n=1 Tax=unclassified Microcoleus TaxID=2642155 RepID=UPI001D268C52|nr:MULTISPECIES: hypothetical protein [unclassified Microcoleus]MCC3418203.1 hypothetical protein [Microcoleus sp. PH2017_07_MST_O_A]MCC3445155.1 hypothetical protein [Microcoleus sp. PH2017_03_ELD_O_A]MCC3469745.1 hypothetical protein [Microcoleus sp. PH2017_06_SFM_O_A]MCC3506794.1 hypothetical protein [Microcoleus sp. PH2017_19_SFW_U_A]MCC3512457.1 hypothetical protein [Microcoleus sp. PH2017_17_BER_D_A]TAE40050.1 MAG: hypothetical protein EAZ90_21170 [Oscillatoriales cyanobacterium]
MGHDWYAIDLAIGLMLYYHSIAIVDRFVQRKKAIKAMILAKEHPVEPGVVATSSLFIQLLL